MGHPIHGQVGPTNALRRIVEIVNDLVPLVVIEGVEEGIGGVNDAGGLIGRNSV